MFAFLGKLMGIAIRGNEVLPLNLPSIVWKGLVGETLASEDLAAVDLSIVNSINRLRNIESEGITDELFGSVFFETFSTVSTDDRVVSLLTGQLESIGIPNTPTAPTRWDSINWMRGRGGVPGW